MIAALLLAVGILAVLGAERNARLLGESAARRLRAVEAAASRLDSARAGCVAGAPVVLVAVTADIPVGGTAAERAVHVETLAACGAPP
jgi:Tfp pilus assembly protein PilV